MKNWSFQKRLMLWLGLLLVLLFGLFAIIEIQQVSSIVDKKSVAELEAQASGVHSTLENSFFMSTAIQKDAVELASSFIEGRVALDYRRPLDVVVTNQVTKEESRVRIPSLLVNKVRVYRKPELIDKISSYTKTTVTIFQHIPKGLLRVATNIKKSDGSFAYGTFIPSSSPVYKKLMKGETYLGRAYVVNGWYITAYRPFKDKSGKVIGAIYTGLSEAKSLQLFLEKSRKALVGSSGHLFAFDSNGKFTLHPTQEGKAAPTIVKKMIQEKNGSYKGPFINRNGDPTDSVMVIRYLEQMDWFIGATVTKDEYMEDIDHSKMFLGIGMLVALFVFLLVLKVTTGKLFKGLNSSISERLISVIDRADAIGKGNSDLLGRTQEQASALTESSSTVEEIVSTVEQTAQNAQNAYSLSQEVSMKASNSAEQSVEVEQAMGSIINSSSKIKDIVALVEEIAFQTNILAINAAIEAAKAGDHGKGFAVVAVEVRELASRSSEAAKDIKELIGESLRNVEVGSELVDQSAKSLQDIAEQVLKVTDLIKEITSASKEEHVALQEINRALATIETNTQQNSSVADNANQNSSNMRHDARDLKEMIRGYMEWN